MPETTKAIHPHIFIHPTHTGVEAAGGGDVRGVKLAAKCGALDDVTPVTPNAPVVSSWSQAWQAPGWGFPTATSPSEGFQEDTNRNSFSSFLNAATAVQLPNMDIPKLQPMELPKIDNPFLGGGAMDFFAIRSVPKEDSEKLSKEKA
jgi:hypothetical protein